MARLRTAAWAAPLLLLPLLAAGPASATVAESKPAPTLTYKSTIGVRPGDTVTAHTYAGDFGYGDTLRSSVFVASGKLRMVDPRLTTTVVIACDARPGTYPVFRRDLGTVGAEEHPLRWARVRVAPADEAARRACRDKVRALPPASHKERWAPDSTWPQSPWDIRTFRPGGHVTITDNDHEGSDGDFTVTSPAFTDHPVLRGARAVLTATATVGCDVKPGVYPLYRRDTTQDLPRELWGRLRVTPAAPGKVCTAQQQDTNHSGSIAWTAGGAALLAAVCTAFALRRRSRTRP